jgi:integrase
MALTDIRVKAARYGSGQSKLFDGGGLFLWLRPNGAKLWRLKYRHSGVEKALSIGVYPEISLKQARAARDEARALLSRGVDPSPKKQAERIATGDTFGAIADEFLTRSPNAPNTIAKARWMIEHLSALSRKRLADIKAPELLAVLRKIEHAGHIETAHRCKQKFGEIARYAIATGRAERDISADLKGALRPVVVENHPAITKPAEIGALMRAINGYQGQPATMAALKLLPHVFLRPGELRYGRWDEIDFDAAEWRIDAERMKGGKRAHLVPLSKQSIAILRDVQALTASRPPIFPAIGAELRPISENTINAALRRLGYNGDVMVSHGFRSIASTTLNELGFHPDLIELQLAHAPADVRAVYNRSQRIEERRKMMQAWSDHLDALAANGNVTAIGAGKPRSKARMSVSR